MEFRFFIGIDVSKDTLDIGFLDAESSETVNHQQVNNNDTGITAMLSWLQKYMDFQLKSPYSAWNIPVCTIIRYYNFSPNKKQAYG